MATYLMLGNYTDQGIRNARLLPRRVNAAKKLAKSFKGTLKQVCLAMGAYDMIATAEFPNDEALAKFMLALGSMGNIRTTTLRVFPEAEFRQIIKALPAA